VQDAFPVGAFFNLVKDFSGINNRYGQIAVPDFLEYLATQLPYVFNLARSVTNTKLQCLRCNWVSYSTSEDILLKLYISPGTTKRISLSELFTYNFITTLLESSVHGQCLRKTSQKSSKELFSDLVCVELIRVTERKGLNSLPVWSKNNIPVTFPTRRIVIPGSTRKYRVIGTSHHKGSFNGGHWVTRICSNNDTWFEAGDLKGRMYKAGPPGVGDSSVVVLVLIAESLIH